MCILTKFDMTTRVSFMNSSGKVQGNISWKNGDKYDMSGNTSK